MTTVNITTQNLTTHPDFSVPTFGLIDFGVPSTGRFSVGYKMIAFEPGKILQAEELNELQFRMQTHENLTMQMISNWIPELVFNGTSQTTGPGWDGATPLDPNYLVYVPTTRVIAMTKRSWFLCKANSNGLFFWLYFQTAGQGTQVNFQIPQETVVNQYIGFGINTTAGGEYTGEIVNCNSVGSSAGVKHPLTLKNSSVCGSSRYYLRITSVEVSNEPIRNDFCAFAQLRSDGLYYLNNSKVKEG
jgi:hypothetical protein